MNTVSIECSSRELTVAILCAGADPVQVSSGSFAREQNRPDLAGTSAVLAPMIQEALKRAGITAADLDLVAVTSGPGSFTGLRVGVVTAKSIAYATGADLIAVNTLEAIAVKTSHGMQLAHGSSIQVVVNAQRQQLFGATFITNASSLTNESSVTLESSITNESSAGSARGVLSTVEMRGEMKLVDRPTWLNSIPAGAIVSGPGLSPLLAELENKNGITVADAPFREPDATTVARIAIAKYESGIRDDIWKLQPVYFRPSYADDRRK